MNKKAHIIGLMAIIFTLLVGCTGVTLDSNPVGDTSAVEESNTSGEMGAEEKVNDLEESYWMRTDYHWESSQDYGIFQVDNETPYEELVTKTVDIHEFAQWFGLGDAGGGIDDVMYFVGVECLRETEAGALYSVHKVEQGGLLYIFYTNYDWETEIRTNGIRAWFYVRERLSVSDFDSLQEDISTIEDVIDINEVEQIYLNCYRADPMCSGLGTDLYTYHYLEDGIYAVKYDLIDEKLVLTKRILVEEFDISFSRESQYYPYYARILDMDWLE